MRLQVRETDKGYGVICERLSMIAAERKGKKYRTCQYFSLIDMYAILSRGWSIASVLSRRYGGPVIMIDEAAETAKWGRAVCEVENIVNIKI